MRKRQTATTRRSARMWTLLGALMLLVILLAACSGSEPPAVPYKTAPARTRVDTMATVTPAPTGTLTQPPASPTHPLASPTATPNPSPTMTPTRSTSTPTHTPTQPPPTATATPTATPAATSTATPASYEPLFKTAECQFEVPDGSDVTCGYLTVPEDRSTPGDVSREVRIHVAIVKSKSADPAPDPFVYLAGGPGGHPLDNINGIVHIFDDVLNDRDLIVFDQRGAGFSEPSLDCPEIMELVIDTLDRNLTTEEEIKLNGQALRACRSRVLREGADLSAYNSAQNAADVRDLRLALGYDEWNLYGVSYGTRLALTVLRDFPTGVRSVILDSVFPPQVDSLAERGANAERAFGLLFERCALDDACNAAFPDLEAAFYGLVAQLDAEPIVVQVQSLDVLLNGDDLIGLLFELLYDSDAIPTLPKLILDVARGSYDDLERWVFRSIVQSVFVSEGMYGSVECVEEYPLSAAFPAANERPGLDQARLGEYFGASLDSSLAICDVWHVDAADAFENGAVTSDVPTLILTGDYDPVTPPAWGRLATETLDRSFYVEFSGVGHGVYGARECARNLVDAFLAAPTAAPNVDCVDDVAIDFVTP